MKLSILEKQVKAEKTNKKESDVEELSVEDLNVAQGFERFDRNPELYATVLRTYASDVRILLKTIEDVETNGIMNYIVTIHGIKGASFELLANRIAEIAKKLEYAAVTGDFKYIKINNPIFIREAHRLLDRIDILLDNIDSSDIFSAYYEQCEVNLFQSK